MRTGLAMGALIGLGACASVHEADCATTDWEGLGYTTGVAGATRSLDALPRAQSCARLGVYADRAAYERGREAGYDVYCNPNRAYDIAMAGGEYHGVCASRGVEAAFLAEFRRGQELYGHTSAVSRAQNRLSRARNTLRAEEESQSRWHARYIAAQTEEERAKAYEKYMTARRRAIAARTEIEQARKDVRHAEVSLNEYRLTLAEAGRPVHVDQPDASSAANANGNRNDHEATVDVTVQTPEAAAATGVTPASTGDQ